MRSLRGVAGVFLAIVVLAFVAVPLIAQVQNGQITGDVTDPSGATVPNAAVTVRDSQTGYTGKAVANATGHFVVNQIPVGTYVVSVSAPGFKTLTRSNVIVHAGTVQHLDAKLQVGQVTETVEVTGAPPQIDVETSRLAQTVTQTQIQNLPLNGRNVYDLIQQTPGAVNVSGVDFENGHNTVVNGLREDFNGFMINGVANKDLSGGTNNTPIQDTVQEFQQLTLNMSAQYGNSAGSITNLVTKSGTNAIHGSAWEFLRNDKLDANQFFLNQQGVSKPKLRFNQFGFTVGGPIIKDKVFFFLAGQGDRFNTVAPPQSITIESPEFRSAVAAAFPNSVANLLYSNFAPKVSGTPLYTLDQYITQGLSGSGFTSYAEYLCPDNTNPVMASRFATLFGVTAADQSAMSAAGCSSIPPITAGAFPRNVPFLNSSVALFPQQTQTIGNLFNGNEGEARIDFTPSDKNRVFLEVNLYKSTDNHGPCNSACTRGFANPSRNIFPNGQFDFVHTFSPKLLNEFRAGYTENNIGINASVPGVPQINFDDATAGFGSYNGYPQFFKDHIYTYSDMVSISKGSHNIKTGVDIHRNIENSEFNVARPSYEMFDPLFFAADAPAEEVAGVNPGFVSNTPAQLADNVRHFRNWEIGAYFQDDWKVNRRLTLNLGLRYDLFTRHTEENNLATTFLLGPGQHILDNITTGAGQLRSANADCTDPRATLAGVCGPGGFSKASSLGAGDHNDFGPRVGFALDAFGDGKTSIRGGFGVSYESTLYNAMSNSRWNPPYYSFNIADNFLNGGTENVIYGPSTCDTTGCHPVSGVAPTFSGPGTNPFMGTGVQASGNLVGWDPSNPQTAYLTGIVLPQGIRDPYVYNFFLSVQHEIAPRLVAEVDYVGTAAHKLFRAEDINRKPGGRLPAGTCVTDNLGRDLCGLVTDTNPIGYINGNYGHLRVWENVNNSNYNALQFSLKKQMSHGFLFNVNYTWSHALDNGSTWHSGATTANGAAAGEGYTTDQTLPKLDYGNALFDIRQRLVFNYVWDLPVFTSQQGFLGHVLGGWELNGLWSFQTGAHWEPYDSRSAKLKCTVPGDITTCVNTGGDYNLDGGRNDRPSSSVPGFSDANHNMWANGWGPDWTIGGIFSTPCLGCVANLRRNTFVGPSQWFADMSLFKNIKITERVNMQFRAESFNVFNHTNFLLAATGGGAHNKVTDPTFGQAAATLNPRNLQFGLRLTW